MKNICLLGATGSIGSQVLDLVRIHPDQYQLKAFSFNHNIDQARRIISEFKPDYVACASGLFVDLLKLEFPSLIIEGGEASLIKVATYPGENAIVINALVGSVGCLPTAEAIKHGRDVLLANKETLVIAGEIIMAMAKQSGVNIIPIDSEHSGLAQILEGKNKEEVKQIILTASGGSLYHKSREDLASVTVREALNHPNWKMGPKITIDSATLMNKGFEMIEAHYLFGFKMDEIGVIVHKESIVHALVEFIDGSVLAQMANPDMHIPILFALNYPVHTSYGQYSSLNLARISHLSFEAIDEVRFPAIKYAKWVMMKKGFYPTVLNAANEAMVQLFLNGIISFDKIDIEVGNLLFDAKLALLWDRMEFNLANIIKIDKIVKEKIYEKFMR